MSTSWDARYAEPGWAYGDQPNTFLAGNLGRLMPGKVLCLAEGQGRNAVFLARRGFAVTALDQSAVGLARAQELADQHGVTIDTVVADLGELDLGIARWDNIVSIFAHTPREIRQSLHRQVVAALRPGGTFLLEAYTPDQLATSGRGGPSVDQADRLMTLADLTDELDGLTFDIAQEIIREVDEGCYHQGDGAVVQIVAHRP